MPEFGAPLWLLLLPLPPVLWWFHLRRQPRDRLAGAVIHPLARTIGVLQSSLRDTRPTPWLWLLGCLLLVIALAQPRWVDPAPDRDIAGHNLILAIDVSGSMRSLDYTVDNTPISRLDMVKLTLRHFLEQAARLRVGVVLFGDDVMTYVPLTTDLALVADMIDEIDNSLAGERTALGDAIALSLRRMQALPDDDTAARSLVLLTDGVPTAGTISTGEAAEMARELGIRIFTVGLGSETPSLFPLSPAEAPMLAEVEIDEVFLRDLAASTGGDYYPVRETADLEQALTAIDRLETTPIAQPVVIREGYWLPALLGLLLLVFAERRRFTAGVTA